SIASSGLALLCGVRSAAPTAKGGSPPRRSSKRAIPRLPERGFLFATPAGTDASGRDETAARMPRQGWSRTAGMAGRNGDKPRGRARDGSARLIWLMLRPVLVIARVQGQPRTVGKTCRFD